jgi:hypothetical protein
MMLSRLTQHLVWGRVLEPSSSHFQQADLR